MRMRRLHLVCITALFVGLLAGIAQTHIAFADGEGLHGGTMVVASQSQTTPSTEGEAAKHPGGPARKTSGNPLSIVVFLAIIAITFWVVFVAAKRTKTSADYYVAHSAFTGTQNGWALAGDYMSAASFLGIAGLISLYGYDGFMYSVGWLVAYVSVLLLIAEPCRNIGRFTLGDILSFRSFPIPVRSMAALSTVVVCTFYLIAQMVGSGRLVELLFGIPYSATIIIVGALMIIYVVFGGMLATTWVQIIKAVLIMAGAIFLSLLVAAKAGFNPVRFFSDVATNQGIQDWVRIRLLNQPILVPGFDYGQRFLEPGLFLKNPLDQISLGMALALGTAGMPHILMRFFTVPNAQEARKSVIVAMFVIGIFYVLTTFLGFGAAIHVGPEVIFSNDPGGNMASILLAKMLGDEIAHVVGDVFLAFLSAVAFATILAVVSGLVLAASAAIAHDVYVQLIKKGVTSQRKQIRVARFAALGVGIVAILIGIASESQNVAQLVALAFAVAASANFPVVVLSLFWRQFNTAGIVAGIFVGTVASVVLVLVSPNMYYPKDFAENAKQVVDVLEKKVAGGATLSAQEKTSMEKARLDYDKNKDGVSLVGLDRPLFPLKNPGIVSIPMGFLAAILIAFAFPSITEEEKFDELLIRQQTGLGIVDLIEDK